MISAMPETLSPLGEAALEYVNRGWPVFPLSDGQKKPRPGSRGFKDATRDEAKIEMSWRDWPDANIAILCLEIVAIDIDRHKADGFAALAKWEERNGKLPQTLTSITPNDGEHRIYRAPAYAKIKSSSGALGPGIDVRGYDGYIVAPPSVVDGKLYRWANDLEPAELPLELAIALTGSGGRNDYLAKVIAPQLRNEGMSGDELLNKLLEINTKLRDPLAACEVKKIAASADRNYDERSDRLDDTDLANARRFAAQHGAVVRFTPERGWFRYDGKRWAADDKNVQTQALAQITAESIFDEIRSADNRDAMYKHARISQSRKSIDNMTHLARSQPGIPARITDFDKDEWLFNAENGTIDLRTGELRTHSPDDLISNLGGTSYVSNALCPLWDGFLRRITADDAQLCGYLQRFAGYALVGTTSDQSLHFFYGTGANGKSVLCNLLQRLLGDYAIIASPELVTLQRHGGIPNDVARLRGVRLALMNETSQGSRFNEAKLKDLTGGDRLTGRFLHQEFFDFNPTHKLIIRGNHKPTISGTDDGIWRRLRLVPFTVTIPESEQDPALLSKLTAELPGILNWAIKGCLEWQRDGLRPPPIVMEAVNEYREESDTLGRFLAERCESTKNGQIGAQNLFDEYKEFCEAASERHVPMRDFGPEMERRGYKRKRGNKGVVFLEIRLKHLPTHNGPPPDHSKGEF